MNRSAAVLRCSGTPRTRSIIQTSCWYAGNQKQGSYLQALYYRIKARRGPKKAIIAVAASILTAIYHMLKDGTMYHDLRADYFNRHSTDRQKTRLIKRLTDLGYAVELKPLAA